jgi:hypothetical protein
MGTSVSVPNLYLLFHRWWNARIASVGHVLYKIFDIHLIIKKKLRSHLCGRLKRLDTRAISCYQHILVTDTQMIAELIWTWVIVSYMIDKRCVFYPCSGKFCGKWPKIGGLTDYSLDPTTGAYATNDDKKFR